MSAATVYPAYPVKRHRRTNAELAAVDQAIIRAVEEDYPVSVRGVFYRVVSAGAVEKTDADYDLIGRQLLKLRRAGAVPYSSITDGTRWFSKPDSWSKLEEMLNDAAASYRRALWDKQDAEVMVFTEKDAITGILSPVTDQWDVPLGVLRGYASETFCYTVAEEIIAAYRRDKYVYLYQFGDHDPWGVEAWAKFSARVDEFVRAKLNGFSNALYERLAVTPRQIADLHLPTRPTKKHTKKFIGESVEVDAIPARELREIVNEAITQHIDEEVLRISRLAEDSERSVLARLAGGFRFTDDDERDAP